MYRAVQRDLVATVTEKEEDDNDCHTQGEGRLFACLQRDECLAAGMAPPLPSLGVALIVDQDVAIGS